MQVLIRPRAKLAAWRLPATKRLATAQIKEQGRLSGAARLKEAGEVRKAPLGPLLVNEHECDGAHGVCTHAGTPDRRGGASWRIQLRALLRASGEGRDVQPSGNPSKRFQLLEKPAVGFSFSSPQLGDPRAVPAQPSAVLKGFEALGPGPAG